MKTKMITVACNPSAGSFSLAQPLTWYTCREKFQPVFLAATEGFFFSHENEQGERISAFIQKAEEVLGLEGMVDPKAGPLPLPFNPPIPGTYEPTRFARTNMKNVTWIAPSWFWRQCAMRRSLLTILLRCGASYEENKSDGFEEAMFGASRPAPDNFEEALFKHSYVQRTQNAVKRFFFGCVDIKFPDNYQAGWVTLFDGAKAEDLKDKLVRPEPLPTNFNFSWV